MSEPITWSLVEVKASELKPNPKNPKVIDAKGMRRLNNSLKKFGVVYDGIMNKDFSIIDGHSRYELNSDPNRMLHYFIPSRQLTAAEYTEFNAIFDIAKAGETDHQILEETMSDEFFEDWEIDKKLRFNNKDKGVKYPIVPEYDEKYDAIIIISSNVAETTYIKNALNIAEMQSYKNSHTGESNVIDARQFIKQWKSK